MTLLSEYTTTKELKEIPANTFIIATRCVNGNIMSKSLWYNEEGKLSHTNSGGGTYTPLHNTEYSYIKKKAKKYEVAVDFGSTMFEIEAVNEKEATAIVEKKLLRLISYECWVADVQEVE